MEHTQRTHYVQSTQADRTSQKQQNQCTQNLQNTILNLITLRRKLAVVVVLNTVYNIKMY